MLTIGALGIYVHSFIQGLFGADFGGRCMSPYMLFLAIFMIADVTLRMNKRLLQRTSERAEPVYAGPSLGSLRFAPVRE